jgi:DNA-binding response OmpR family regulator
MVHRILVADDDDLVRDALTDLLELEGYEVQAAYDGQHALELAVNGARPDLVIADLQMPRLRGDHLIDRLRAADVTAPVIIATASRVTPAVLPDRIIHKPFNIDDFLATIRDLLRQSPNRSSATPA